jgi:hypothetical protein
MTRPRVCVLGAGASGISTARLLVRRGYEVQVLERSDRVGGMCRSIAYVEPDTGERRFFDVGANYITKDYREVRALAQELNLELVTDTAFQNQVALDVGTGRVVPGKVRVNEGISRVSFLCASVKYLWLLRRYRDVVQKPGFVGVADKPDLLRPFDQWLDAHGLNALARLFMIPITAFGYGQLDEVPTPAAMKYIDSGRFLSMLATGLNLKQSWPRRVRDGFGTLMERAAAELDVETDVRVDRVVRREGRVEVHVRGEAEPRVYDRLVVAMPPDKAVDLLDATDDERRLFAPGVIEYRDFRITTAEVPGFPYQVVLELEAAPDGGGRYPGGARNPGHPWIFGKQWDDSRLLLFYANVPHDTTEHAVREQARLDCEVALRAGRQGRWAAPHKYQRWPEYFPHVSIDDMRDFAGTGEGWYDLVQALQGQQSTYWVHGVIAFELVEAIMEYAREVVEGHFPQVGA